MTSISKSVEDLQVSDFISTPVWEYINDDDSGELLVRAVSQIPVESLGQKLVGTRVRLASGELVWACIGNVDESNPKSTMHFLTLSVEKNSQWFMLARYHDFDYLERGPDALANFLGIPSDAVFPIAYDVTQYAKGDLASLSGHILREPTERLSQQEIIALAVGSR
jgi:hypothetical protein